jgi:tripartite-type tricarboxylate transporter receptor subunit TctC
MQNRRVGKALSTSRQRRSKACPPQLVSVGTARDSIAELLVRSRRLCPPYGFALRRIWSALAVVLLLTGISSSARAQDWPSRPIRFIVPVAPGGATDVTARLLQEPISRALGVPIIVENKPGGAGVIATESVIRSAPDGYTFAIVYTSHAGNPALLASVPYDSVKDITPVAFVWRAFLAFSVHKDVPINSIAELIARAKAEPGKLSYATGGIGQASHFAGARLEQMAGIKLALVPYRGAGPALTDVLGGHVPILVSNISVAAPEAATGRLRPLAVTSPERSPILPDIPTVAELGFPGYQVSEWFGVIGPAGLPDDIVNRMNKAINDAARTPDVLARFNAMGVVLTLTTPAGFKDILAEETRVTTNIIRKGNIKP